jgi:hypothetical protein
MSDILTTTLKKRLVNSLKELGYTVEWVDLFKLNGDYKREILENKEKYLNKIIIDNPPFSKIREICEFLQEHNINFFLLEGAGFFFKITWGIFENKTRKPCLWRINNFGCFYSQSDIYGKTRFYNGKDSRRVSFDLITNVVKGVHKY